MPLSILRPSLVCVCLLSASALYSRPASADQPPSEASLYFSSGVDLLQTSPPNYQDAYRQFLIAYEKSGRSWKVLGNLGLCAVNLERDGEAISYYTEYLEKGGADIDSAERAGIEKDLLLLKGNLSKLHVTGEPGKPLTLTVKREGSAAPMQLYKLPTGEGDLGLRAGSQLITAESGGKKVTVTLVLSPGEGQDKAFDFSEPKPDATTKPSGAPASEAKPEETKLSTLAWVGIGTGGAGLVTLGAGLILGAGAKSSESSALAGCRSTSSGDQAWLCPEAQEAAIDSAASQASTANILIIAGSALTAAGVTLFFIGGEEKLSPQTGRFTFTPVASPTGGSLRFSGTF